MITVTKLGVIGGDTLVEDGLFGSSLVGLLVRILSSSRLQGISHIRPLFFRFNLHINVRIQII